jgi:hypothetical protein
LAFFLRPPAVTADPAGAAAVVALAFTAAAPDKLEDFFVVFVEPNNILHNELLVAGATVELVELLVLEFI